METQESRDISAVVDRFPEWARFRIYEAVLRIAECYRASGVGEPLAELRRQHRETRRADDDQEGRCAVIRLADRRRVS